MQYLAFWDEDVRRGVYYGLHDGAPASKFIHFSRSADGVVTLKIAQPLENIADGCNSQKLYGVCVWQPFDGDWYDAAMLYRAWALSEASWRPKSTKTAARTSPLWFKANPHWWWTRMEDDRWWTRENRDETVADEVVRATAELGTTKRGASLRLAQDSVRQRLPALLPRQGRAGRRPQNAPRRGHQNHALHQRPPVGYQGQAERGLAVQQNRLSELHEGPPWQALHRDIQFQGDRRHKGRVVHHVPLDRGLAGKAERDRRQTVQRAGYGRGLHRPDRRGQGQPLRGQKPSAPGRRRHLVGRPATTTCSTMCAARATARS